MSMGNPINKDSGMEGYYELIYPKGAGYLVKTKHGEGRTYHSVPAIDGKQTVYLNDGRRLLCKWENLEMIGFVD